MTDVANQRALPEWTFLSNHTHVLHCIFLSPDIRIRDIAEKVQITERAVQRIVVDLEVGGYVKRARVGRQNHYRIKPARHLRHPLEFHVQVGRLLAVLKPESSVPTRASNGAHVRASAAASSRSTKRPSRPRKLMAKKSV